MVELDRVGLPKRSKATDKFVGLVSVVNRSKCRKTNREVRQVLT